MELEEGGGILNSQETRGIEGGEVREQREGNKI